MKTICYKLKNYKKGLFNCPKQALQTCNFSEFQNYVYKKNAKYDKNQKLIYFFAKILFRSQ